MAAVHQLIVRIAKKAPLVVCVVALLSIGAGAALMWADDRKLEGGPQLRLELAKVEAKLAEAQARIEQIQVDIPPEQERVLRSEKVIEQLKQLKSRWDWLVGNREQQRSNAKRLEDMQAFHASAVARVAGLQQELRRTRWESDGYVIEQDELAKRLREDEAWRATWRYRWWRIWLQARGWIPIGMGGYLLAFVLAPAVWTRRRERRAMAVK